MEGEILERHEPKQNDEEHNKPRHDKKQNSKIYNNNKFRGKQDANKELLFCKECGKNIPHMQRLILGSLRIDLNARPIVKRPGTTTIFKTVV